MSPSVVEAVAWAASAAAGKPVNSAHLLFGLTMAHGVDSEVRQLLAYFGASEDRLFAELPDLDNVPAQGPPVPPLGEWPQLTEVSDQIYAMASQLSTTAPFGDARVHIPHLMAALILLRPDAAIALEMALPPLPPFWLQHSYDLFLPVSSSSKVGSFLSTLAPPVVARQRLIGREDVLQQLDSVASAPGVMVQVIAAPGSGSTAVMLEFLQRSARRYRDGVSYINGMPNMSDAALRVPVGRLVVIDHVGAWPVQMSVASTGTLVVVGSPGVQGSMPFTISALSDAAMQEIAVTELGAVGVRPTLADVEKILTLAAGRVDVLVTIIRAYPRSGRSFAEFLAWVASVPPGPADRDSVMSAEVEDAYRLLGSLPYDQQFLLKHAVFLGSPLISPDQLAALTGTPELDLLSLQRLAAGGFLTPVEPSGFSIPETVVAAVRRFFDGQFDAAYFMRLIDAATTTSPDAGSTAPQVSVSTLPEAPVPTQPNPPVIQPSPPPPPRPPAPDQAPESLGYTATDYAADIVPGGGGVLADALHRAADVEAVCMLATLKAAKPPLSIGLFGEWGSGKTFFMRMVADRIKTRSDKLKDGSSVFCTRVKHIWFNAWHYSDNELWASLVTHIFQELAKETKLTPPSIEDQKTELDNAIKGLKHKASKEAADAVLRDETVKATLKTLQLPEDSLGQLADFRKWALVVWRGLNWWQQVIVLGTMVSAIGAVALLATRRDAFSLAATLVPFIGAYFAVFHTKVRDILDFARQTNQKLKQVEEAREGELARLERERKALDQPVEAFIQERLLSADYEKRMGLISTARRDFEELSRRLAGPSSSDPDRIILYIDDLDRCTPKVVVQVLEAIHLLLAFELFVVIVGVDSRWLVAALEQHLELVAERESGKGITKDGARASPQDYLEKIFQVPIQVKRMGPDDFKALVKDIVGDGVRATGQTPSAVTTAPPEAAATPSTQVVAPVLPVAETSATSNGGSPVTSSAAPFPAATPSADSMRQPAVQPAVSSVAAAPAPTEAPASTPAEPYVDPNPEKLQLYKTEVDLLKGMSPLISTPRSAKRLLNTYRLVRAGIDGPKLRTFVSDDGAPGPYQAAILLLSIMIGFPDQFGEVFRAIRDAGTKSFTRVLEDGASWGAIKQKVANTLQDVAITDDIDVFRRALPLVSRYSFKEWETYEDLVPAKPTTARPAGASAPTN